MIYFHLNNHSFLCFPHPLIPHPIYCFDICIAIRFYFPPQAADGGCQGMLVHEISVRIPQFLQKKLPCQYLSGIFAEKMQHFILHRGQCQRPAIQCGTLPHKIQKKLSVIINIRLRPVIFQHGENGFVI